MVEVLQRRPVRLRGHRLPGARGARAAAERALALAARLPARAVFRFGLEVRPADRRCASSPRAQRPDRTGCRPARGPRASQLTRAMRISEKIAQAAAAYELRDIETLVVSTSGADIEQRQHIVTLLGAGRGARRSQSPSGRTANGWFAPAPARAARSSSTWRRASPRPCGSPSRPSSCSRAEECPSDADGPRARPRPDDAADPRVGGPPPGAGQDPRRREELRGLLLREALGHRHPALRLPAHEHHLRPDHGRGGRLLRRRRHRQPRAQGAHRQGRHPRARARLPGEPGQVRQAGRGQPARAGLVQARPSTGWPTSTTSRGRAASRTSSPRSRRACSCRPTGRGRSTTTGTSSSSAASSARLIEDGKAHEAPEEPELQGHLRQLLAAACSRSAMPRPSPCSARPTAARASPTRPSRTGHASPVCAFRDVEVFGGES